MAPSGPANLGMSTKYLPGGLLATFPPSPLLSLKCDTFFTPAADRLCFLHNLRPGEQSSLITDYAGRGYSPNHLLVSNFVHVVPLPSLSCHTTYLGSLWNLSYLKHFLPRFRFSLSFFLSLFVLFPSSFPPPFSPTPPIDRAVAISTFSLLGGLLTLL